MNRTETHIVPEKIKPTRLQEYGTGIFDLFTTRSAWKKALKKHYVTVNGAPANSATFIRGGESIQLIVAQKATSTGRFVFPLKVLFEDRYLAVIHKPAGILVSGNSFKTITNALAQNLEPSKLSDATRPQPVHRLDYATTGVLLVGKTGSSIRVLNKMFEEKEIEKVYCAITIGEMHTGGEINSPIDGKVSRSCYALCDSVLSKRFGKLNLVQLTPHTGRRHQLRKHMAAIGNPILGDKEYGFEGLILKGKGLYLHALSLAFVHPFTGEELRIDDDLPHRFKKIFPKKIPERDKTA